MASRASKSTPTSSGSNNTATGASNALVLSDGATDPPDVYSSDEPWNLVFAPIPSATCGYRQRVIGSCDELGAQYSPDPRLGQAGSDTVGGNDGGVNNAISGGGAAAARALRVLSEQDSSTVPVTRDTSDTTRDTTTDSAAGAFCCEGDTLSAVFRFLDAVSLLRCARVCRQWCDQVTRREELTWRRLCLESWELTARSAGSWREEHRRRVLLDRAWLSPTGYKVLPRGIGHRRPVEAFALRTDGTAAVSGGGETVVLWDVGTGAARKVHHLEASVACLALGSTGLLLGLTNGSVQLHHPESLQLIWTAAGHKEEGTVESCCLAAHDAVTGGCRGLIMVWAAQNGELVAVLRGHHEEVRSLHPSLHPGPFSFFSTSFETDIKAWRGSSVDESDLKPALVAQLRGHTEDVTSFALSGRRAISGGSDRTVRLWCCETARLVLTMSGHAGEIYCVDISVAIGLASSGDSRSEVRLWDLSTGACVAKLVDGHIGCIRVVKLSRTRLVSAGDRRRVVVWDLKTTGTKHMILSR